MTMNKLQMIFAPRPSQRQLAKSAGVDGSFVTLILQGKRRPSQKVAKRLASALDVTVEELMEFLESRRSSEVAA